MAVWGTPPAPPTTMVGLVRARTGGALRAGGGHAAQHGAADRGQPAGQAARTGRGAAAHPVSARFQGAARACVAARPTHTRSGLGCMSHADSLSDGSLKVAYGIEQAWAVKCCAVACVTSCALRREMDVCLAQLAGALPCDCMPGGTDPANHALPQQPLHPCLLPGAVSFPTFNRCVFGGTGHLLSSLAIPACHTRFHAAHRPRHAEGAALRHHDRGTVICGRMQGDQPARVRGGRRHLPGHLGAEPG